MGCYWCRGKVCVSSAPLPGVGKRWWWWWWGGGRGRGRGLALPGGEAGLGQGAVDDGADGLGALALQEGAMVALHHVDRHRAVAHLQAGERTPVVSRRIALRQHILYYFIVRKKI